ncbi:MAG: universal stress protein [Candidatus Obscuribacterales bacterium]|nr:universal stress protein [Candidatus Obscuribacterales bacterium]
MKVVVAIDGQQSADSVLQHVAERNYGPETQVHLIHVITPMFADTHVDGIPDVVADEKKEEKTVLDNLAKGLKDKLGITATSAILSGETASVIAEECKRLSADELIVPSHHRHGFSRLWFGSVADAIVDAAPCATLVLNLPQEHKH